MNYSTLSLLRDRHPAWRLLAWPHAPLVASIPEVGENEGDTGRLFNQIVVDKARLRAAIQGALRLQTQVSLRVQARVREQASVLFLDLVLDQLRHHFPGVRSLLMDRETLLAHRDHWGEEPEPTRRELPRLSTGEAELYDELRSDRLQVRLRLEQERVRFGWLLRRLDSCH